MWLSCILYSGSHKVAIQVSAVAGVSSGAQGLFQGHVVVDRTHVLEAVELTEPSLFKTSNGGREGGRGRESEKETDSHCFQSLSTG